MQLIRLYFIIIFLLSLQSACRQTEKAVATEPPSTTTPAGTTNITVPTFPSETFAYPIGKVNFITEKKDRDDWYNAQNFGENRHLGEDWNMNTGGNTDCGQPVFAVAEGRIVYAQYAGEGWGNVVIIEHTSPDGGKIQSLYGHLQTLNKKEGTVKKRELLGTVGNADGRYLCHLHFEIRIPECPFWNLPGNGYGDDNKGWLDPSEFIERHRKR